jgi:glycosyltransferase involved in cell wall biosynthesis
MKRVLLIEGCDFERHPVGGQLTFATQLLSAFGSRLALVGLTSGQDPIGTWTKKRIERTEYDYFAVGSVNATATRPLVPSRLSMFLQVRRWKSALLAAQIRDVLVLAPEVLMALHRWGWDSICFSFAGVTNPLTKPRYPWARHLSQLFERAMFRSLSHADVILAAADHQAVTDLVRRSAGTLTESRIIQFPTFVDMTVFRPRDSPIPNVGHCHPRIVSCGRLNRVKGWELVIAAFERLVRRHQPSASLVFVGDGEDRRSLEAMVDRLALRDRVSITGFVDRAMVANHLSAADVVVTGSHFEGWPTSVLEALACGVPVVSTSVGGVHELIRDGRNGFVVSGRDPEAFSRAINDCLALPDARSECTRVAAHYALETMPRRLGELWSPLL